ncbi:hypothetical protein M8J76_002542 [Diaphorina citri]|nr:hypothetical protein M8J76_002542 [Diaphorina citri]
MTQTNKSPPPLPISRLGSKFNPISKQDAIETANWATQNLEPQKIFKHQLAETQASRLNSGVAATHNSKVDSWIEAATGSKAMTTLIFWQQPVTQIRQMSNEYDNRAQAICILYNIVKYVQCLLGDLLVTINSMSPKFFRKELEKLLNRSNVKW